MIEKTSKNDQINNILKQNFNGYVTTYNPFEKCITYKKNDEMIGIVLYSIIYERAEIDYIWVDNKYRRHHIATKLLDSVINDVKKANCINISLEVNEENTAAIKLYQKYNFQTKAIRHNYYGKKDGYLLIKEVK